MTVLTDWTWEGFARGLGIVDKPRRRPALPRHVETYTVDPPRVRTAPVLRVVPDEPDPEEPIIERDPLPAVLSILVTSDGDRADLVADQQLPARFVVRTRAGQDVATFFGCEFATRFARLSGPHTVIRLEDGAAMTTIVPVKPRRV